MIAEILGKHTKMPVAQVEDGMPVQPNHVYVIRPGHTMTIRDGQLHLGDRVEKARHSRPVDDFFRSLAEEQRERAVCVVMSGMGSNGTAGAQAVKAVGGLCVAQDPESAPDPSMPRHLIDAGYADYIAPPAGPPDLLLAYAPSHYATGGRAAPPPAPPPPPTPPPPRPPPPTPCCPPPRATTPPAGARPTPGPSSSRSSSTSARSWPSSAPAPSRTSPGTRGRPGRGAIGADGGRF